MASVLMSQEYKNFQIVCQVHGCIFQGHVTPVADLKPEDIELLAKAIEPGFEPTAGEESFLMELLGDNLTCPTHGHKDLGLIYEMAVIMLASNASDLKE